MDTKYRGTVIDTDHMTNENFHWRLYSDTLRDLKLISSTTDVLDRDHTTNEHI